MADDATQTTTIDDVERQMAAGHRYLAFSPTLEAIFERDTQASRTRVLLVSGTIALILYDLFLLHDWQTMRDIFPAMLVARLGIFTPLLLLVLFWGSRYPGAAIREGTSSFAAIVATLLPMTVMVFSDSPNKLAYQFGTVLIMIFSTVVQRLRFRYSAFTLVTIVTIQCISTHIADVFDFNGYVANVLFFCTSLLLLLMSGYILEHSERKEFLFALHGSLLHAELSRSARTDPLTGLPNRRDMTDTLDVVWAEARTLPRKVAVVLLDIDRFKAFNDTQGHLAGDACIVAIGQCVKEALAGTCARPVRFGGEEFLVFLPDGDLDGARRAAVAIRAAIHKAALPHPVLGEGAIVTASFGIAAGAAPANTAAELIAGADEALYAAKKAGRDCIWPPLGRAEEMDPTTIRAA